MSVKPTDVILHAFDWHFDTIAERASEIARIGYKNVLISPPAKSLKGENERTKWWQRYQPQDYRVIDSDLGNAQSLRTMVETLREYGVGVYVDVVFNHMANEAWLRDDLTFPSEAELTEYQKSPEYAESVKLFGDLTKPLFTEEHFEPAFPIKNWKDRWEVQNGRIAGDSGDTGLPTLAVCNHVIEQQVEYLTALKSLGVVGFRVDAAKHMKLEHIKSVFTPELVDGMHVFGEIITDGGANTEEYDTFLHPFLKETSLAAYDFPLFVTMYGALEQGDSMSSLMNPYSYGNALSGARAITFAVTHDIPNNDVFLDLVMSKENEWLAQCHILGRGEGVPLIYADNDESGIACNEGAPRWSDAWKSGEMEDLITFHNLSHGQITKELLVDDDYIIYQRGGGGIVAMNKSDSEVVVDVCWGKPMIDLNTSFEVQNRGDSLTVTIPPKGYTLLVDIKYFDC
ncbi:alpha-amylase family protein [Vibrio crassostreae]|uniref:alpha-amylase family protein n=1 Tax=Vibrio crassostreae TaxID=246167 RepID=UPI001FEEC134|nr:alpha-amylase family protein [Vibrio crassostreae]